MRLGLIGAAVAAVVAGLGFALDEWSSGLWNVPLVMAVAGVVHRAGRILLAVIAFIFGEEQRKAPQRRG